MTTMKQTKTTARAATITVLLLSAGLLGACANTGNPYPYRSQGNEAMKGERYQEAYEAYSRYIELRPGEPDMRNALGRSLLALNRYEDAIEHLRIASSQDPENGTYLDDLCEGLLKAGRTEEMFRLLRGNTDNRGNVGDWLRLGRFAAKAGDPDTAKTALLTAARIDRGMTVEPQLELADLAWSLNDKALATQRLRMAAYVAPRSPDVANRIKNWNITTGPTFPLVPAERVTDPAK